MNTANDATSLAKKQNKAVSYKVGIILIPRFNMYNLISAIEPMRIANFLLQETHYHYEYFHCDAVNADAIVSASNDMQILCQPLDDSKTYDLLLVLGSWGCEHQTPAHLNGFLRKTSRQGTLICSFELGVYALARAGLLTDKTCTTHWSYVAGLQEEFPNINVSEQLFTIDKNIASCAGGVAGIDFSLHLIEQHHGTALVAEITDQMMLNNKRPATAPQRNMLGSTTGMPNPDIKKVIELIQSNITDPPNIPAIAKFIGISQRQLERRCKEQMGCSLIQLSQILRLEHARTLLVSTRLSILDISVASGFNSVSHFSQSFRRYYQKKPSHYRKAWPEREAQPLWGGKFTALNHKVDRPIEGSSREYSPKYAFPKPPSKQPRTPLVPYGKSSYKKPLNIKPVATKNIPSQNN